MTEAQQGVAEQAEQAEQDDDGLERTQPLDALPDTPNGRPSPLRVATRVATCTTSTRKLRRPMTHSNAMTVTKQMTQGDIPKSPTGGVWSRAGRFDEPLVQSPGPSSYMVPNKINGRSLGAYAPGYTMRARTLGGMGTGFSRTKNDSCDAITPGPGHYDLCARGNQGKTFSPLIVQKEILTPGPADYNQLRECVGKSGSMYTMRARTQSAWAADMGADWRQSANNKAAMTLKNSHSAPTLANKRGLGNGPGGGSLIADALTPGPSDYMNTKEFGSFGPKKTMSSRHKMFTNNNPGPTAYSPNKYLDLGREGPKFTLHDRTKFRLGGSFIDGDTSNHRPPVITPGPGRYTFNSSFRMPSFNKLSM